MQVAISDFSPCKWPGCYADPKTSSFLEKHEAHAYFLFGVRGYEITEDSGRQVYKEVRNVCFLKVILSKQYMWQSKTVIVHLGSPQEGYQAPPRLHYKQLQETTMYILQKACQEVQGRPFKGLAASSLPLLLDAVTMLQAVAQQPQRSSTTADKGKVPCWDLTSCVVRIPATVHFLLKKRDLPLSLFLNSLGFYLIRQRNIWNFQKQPSVVPFCCRLM